MRPFPNFALLPLIPILLASSACIKNRAINSSIERVKDSIPVLSGKLFIKDSTQYSSNFINSLRKQINYNFPDTINLINNLVVSPGHQSVPFPEYPKIGESYTLVAQVDKYKYELGITRKNLSDIDFYFVLKEDGKIIFNKKGTSILGPLFFLGSESNEDDNTNVVYGAYEYGINENGCLFTIRVGDRTDDGELKGTVWLRDCINEKINRLIKNCPTLRAKVN